MPDITMCNGTGCPQKEQCYRYTAICCLKPVYRQSFFQTPPWEKEKKQCQYFWNNEGERNRE